MHIAVFIYSLRGGGAQKRAVTLACGFADRGHKVDLLVVSSDSSRGVPLSPGVNVIALDRGWRRGLDKLNGRVNVRGLLTASVIPMLARYLRTSRPDVLLSAASHVNLVAAAARRMSGADVTLVLRASNYPSGNIGSWPALELAVRKWLRRTVGRVYPWADHIIAVSNGVGEGIRELTGMSKDRVTTIYSPIVEPEIERLAAAPVDHPWANDPGVPLLLGVGRLTVQKDVPTLLRAFARVRAARPARLVFLGEGRQRARLEQLIREMGLEADVALVGRVDNPFAWFSKASVFVLSSAWEGLPGVVIEALACGCPIVSTDCPSGPREILDEGRLGPLVAVRDDKGLAEAILSVLDAPLDRATLVAGADRFRIDPAVDNYVELLTAQVAKRKAQSRSAH